jgi:hypothetical protein
MKPAPECSTSIAAPVTDTALATASVVLLGLGVAALVDATAPCKGEFCGIGNAAEAGGIGAILVGALSGTLFTTSAVVGYQRTSACRDSLGPDALPRARQVVPATSLLQAAPWEACTRVGDAPRVCTNATTWN